MGKPIISAGEARKCRILHRIAKDDLGGIGDTSTCAGPRFRRRFGRQPPEQAGCELMLHIDCYLSNWMM